MYTGTIAAIASDPERVSVERECAMMAVLLSSGSGALPDRPELREKALSKRLRITDDIELNGFRTG
jgi:hypothetical protein